MKVTHNTAKSDVFPFLARAVPSGALILVGACHAILLEGEKFGTRAGDGWNDTRNMTEYVPLGIGESVTLTNE